MNPEVIYQTNIARIDGLQRQAGLSAPGGGRQRAWEREAATLGMGGRNTWSGRSRLGAPTLAPRSPTILA
jgi:hypothetical protein